MYALHRRPGALLVTLPVPASTASVNTASARSARRCARSGPPRARERASSDPERERARLAASAGPPHPRNFQTAPRDCFRPTPERMGLAEKPVQKRPISGTFRSVLDPGFRRGDGNGKSLRVPPVSGDFSTPLGPRDGAGLGGIRRRLWARGPHVRRPKHRSRTSGATRSRPLGPKPPLTQ